VLPHKDYTLRINYTYKYKTKEQLQRQNTQIIEVIQNLQTKKHFNLDLKCLAEVAKTSTGIEFQVKMVLTKKEYQKAFIEEVKH